MTVYLNSELSQAQLDQLDNLMASHDPRQLTAEQQARQVQQQQLADARQNYKGSDLDPANYASDSARIQALARKIAWLEQEVIDLRGGSDG